MAAHGGRARAAEVGAGRDKAKTGAVHQRYARTFESDAESHDALYTPQFTSLSL